MNKIILTTALVMLSLGNAQAAPVSYTITGDVLLGDEFGDVNDFGLTEFETVTVTGIFNDSVLTSGGGTISFGVGSGNSMTLLIGTETLFATDDKDYAGGGQPTLSFTSYTSLTSAVLSDFDFLTGLDPAVLNYFSSFGLGFEDGEYMFGDWQTNVQITAVPVPAAVWLFGSGLLGLAGIARRKTV